jgi:class 3 adenylate cyclase
MSCPFCDSWNPSGAHFCGRCGRPLERSCPACGTQLGAGVVFCTTCGAQVDPSAGAERETRDERKVVSVLFADMVGSTSRAEDLDPEDVRAFLVDYYARVRSELERFGGTVEKFIGDAVVALFGAPAAHEDDAERAVRAALAVRGAVEEMADEDLHVPLRVRIGVRTGEVLVALGARTTER